jgi:hypothetical protein
MTTDTFFSLTNIHVTLSLVGIISGFVVAIGMILSRRLPGWTELFIGTTILTSVTGFFFPIHGITPGIIFGIISLVVLPIAIVARHAKRLAGPWRWIYVVTAMIALYLNVFVLIVQLFQKVPALKALDPTQSGMPFKLSQGLTLALFAFLTVLGMRKFHPAP